MSVVVVAPANANQRIDSSATTSSSSREDLLKATSPGSGSQVSPQDSQGQQGGGTPVQADQSTAGALGEAAASGTPDTPDGDNVSTGTTLTTPGDELPQAALTPSGGVTHPHVSTMDPFKGSHLQGNRPTDDTNPGGGQHDNPPPLGTVGRQGSNSSSGGRINDAYTANPDIELQSYARRKKGVVDLDHNGSSTTDFNTDTPGSSHKVSFDKNLQLVGLNPMFGSNPGLSNVYEGRGDKAGGLFRSDHSGSSDAIQVRIIIS